MPSPPPAGCCCPGPRRAAQPAMSSPFLAGSSSSSASSHLSYLIPPRPPPPPPPHPMVQGYSCGVVEQAAGYGGNGVGSVMTTGGGSGVRATAAAARQGGRHAGHPPLPRPPPRQCPRCRSANTKFCYYNNYSRKQPRYFRRACRRHWTEGGTLRDVPVGGGRKNRRGGGKDGAAKASTTATAASAAATAAAQGSSGGGAIVDEFPDILRQMLFQAPASCTAVGGGGYSIDLNAWQQMASATAPQGASDVGAVRGTAADANCGGVQYWSGWQLQDDIPGFDGTF